MLKMYFAFVFCSRVYLLIVVGFYVAFFILSFFYRIFFCFVFFLFLFLIICNIYNNY